MARQPLDAAYLAERVSVEMNGINRFISRAFSLPGGPERNLLLDQADIHYQNVGRLLREAKAMTTEVVQAETTSLKVAKLPNSPKRKHTPPDLED